MQTAKAQTRLSQAARPAASFEASYATHRSQIYHLGLRYGGGDAAWAEDLTHDVFIRLHESFDRLSDRDDLGGWLYRVASNLAISRLRRQQSFFGRVSQRLAASEPTTSPPAHQALEDRQEAARALAALAALPAKERVVVAMKLLDDKSQKEIADTLSMSEGYVSKLVKRGLERIAAQGFEVAE